MADSDSHAPTSVRILHISGRSDHGGGPEHLFQIIAAAQPGLRHCVACPLDGVYWARYRDLLGLDALCAIPSRSFSPRAWWRLRTFAQRNHIQVIHGHGTAAGAYSRLLGASLGRPVLHSFHGVSVHRDFKHHLYDLAEGLLGRMTACAIAVSAGEADIAEARWPHYRGKLVVVPNGIEPACPIPSWAPWPAQGPMRIVSFTRRNRQKHPELLISIARELLRGQLDFRIDAYGEGLDHPELAAMVTTHGVHERLRFHPPTDNPFQALAGGHIYLSTSRWEGMPLAVIEAWRAGLVVVASDVVGNRDLVLDGRTGFLYPSEDDTKAAQLIRALSGGTDTAGRIRECADRSARTEFSRECMTGRLESIYHILCRGRSTMGVTDA